MGKLYSITQIAKMIGVSPETIRNWELARLIPEAWRMGLQRKRVWNEGKLQIILEFARDNGYPIRDKGDA